MSNKPFQYAAAGVAAVVIAFGAYALGNSNSDNGTAGLASASQTGGGARLPQTGQAPQDGQLPQGGQAPPGFGTPATGAAAEKAKAAALARYSGSVERVMKLGDGSYEVHVITSKGEYHVLVSKDFKVTGTEQGGPGGHGGSAPPAGTAPQSGSATPSGSLS